MPTWVDSSFWGAKVADCGPYIGDWPPYPPLPATLALEPDTSELDYFVAVPNPAGDAGAVADDSYDTPWLDLWRYGSGPSDWTYLVGASGSATADASVMPVGAHLFVFWYEGAGSVPANDALALAPANMVAGGTGPSGGFASGGSWSAWQDETPFDSDASVTRFGYERENTRDGGDPAVPPAGDAYPNLLTSPLDPVTVVRGEYAGAVAGVPFDSSDYLSTGPVSPPIGTSFGAETTLHVEAAQSTVGGNHYYTDVSADTNVWATTFDFTPPTGDFQPAGYADLTPGIDYAITVDQLTGDAPFWERDPGGAITWAWDHISPTVTASSSNVRVTQVTTTGPIDGGDSVSIVLVADDTEASLYDMGAGTTLWADGPTVQTDTVWTPTIDLSGLPTSAFTVAGRLASQADPTALAFMTTETPPANNTSSQSDAFSNLNILGTAQARVQFPRWRYWSLGVKWHTIAGSWASISGAAMAIFTPGLGPVEYADGPA